MGLKPPRVVQSDIAIGIGPDKRIHIVLPGPVNSIILDVDQATQLIKELQQYLATLKKDSSDTRH